MIMSFHRMKAQAEPPHQQESDFKQSWQHILYYSDSSNMPIAIHKHLSEQTQHQHVKVPFPSPRPWGMHAVNAEGLGAASWDMGIKKKTLNGDLKETEFAKKLSCFESKFLCLGVAAKDNLFPTCTRLFPTNSRAVCRQCRY